MQRIGCNLENSLVKRSDNIGYWLLYAYGSLCPLYVDANLLAACSFAACNTSSQIFQHHAIRFFVSSLMVQKSTQLITTVLHVFHVVNRCVPLQRCSTPPYRRRVIPFRFIKISHVVHRRQCVGMGTSQHSRVALDCSQQQRFGVAQLPQILVHNAHVPTRRQRGRVLPPQCSFPYCQDLQIQSDRLLQFLLILQSLSEILLL